MSITLFEALEGPLKEHAALVNRGVPSEQATNIIFDHWPVEEEDNNDFQADV